MKLNELRQLGGFISSEPIKKSVTWKHDNLETGEQDSTTFDVFVLQISYAESSKIIGYAADLENHPTPEHQARQNAALVSTCCRFGDAGEDELSFDEAMRADTALMAVLSRAVAEVVYPKKKRSRKRTPSGTTSSSPESAAKQSPKQSKISQ